MPGYAAYLLSRLGQFVLVVFIGMNISFIVTHSTPIDPVEQTIAAATQYGSTNPEAIALMRQSLRELYGLEGGLGAQYVAFWRRIAVGDFGPSLSAFPTPVAVLVGRAIPWTVGLLVVSTVLTWILGNALGGLAGYYRKNRVLRFAGILAMAFHPIPYYIVAFILLITFGYLWPVLPISGGYMMNMERGFNLGFIMSLLEHSILPILSLVLVGLGGWFMGMRSLVSNVVTEDYVTYAELGGVSRRRILVSYVMRNALVPQVTGLAMSLGAIFNGAIITEQVFGYPGIGTLLVSAVHAGDYSLVLGITSVSIVAVSAAVLMIDLLYPLLDPRVRAR
ncbi:ABC transporter permease [Vineibacter terrae]|uniref:ABC transporter permease n=1 Tax=Vineibacter terrae TaxID=2586908 RepID=A0A5C8PQP7_9HYPH|nr:ABC transporter permease [Vineibacter terrae]TXL77704.1 ABC transporter permease [Vineibacter terrae]